MGSQCRFELFHMRVVSLAVRSRFAEAALMALRTSKASPRDGVGGLGGGGVRMSSPSAMLLAFSKALSRAIFRVMSGWEPSPVLRFLPLIVKICLQINLSPPPARSLTTRVSPWLPVAIATFARYLDGPDEGLGESWRTFACHGSLLL